MQRQQAEQEQVKEPKVENQKEKQEPRICQFYVSRKRRSCKFIAIAGSKYCSVHCSDQTDKVECPYEKGMFIDASRLQKHLQICPKIKNKKIQEQSQWFTKGVNLNQQQKVEQADRIASVDDIQEDLLMQVIRKVIKLFLKSFGEKSKAFLWTTQEQKIDNLTKDHVQAYLLAQIAFRAGLIRDDIIYLEFGAGKGILSYHLAQKVKKQCKKMSKNVLLQREVRRNKFDRFMKDNPYFQRFKSDVSDFDVSKMPLTMAEAAKVKKPDLDVQKQAAQLNQLQIVGVCKHMCGAALDISLRALLKTKMSGCILASCCHHLCSYDSYLNNNFFESEAFSPNQIQIVFKISAWGTKASTVNEAEIDFEQLSKIPFSQLQQNIKVIIGRMCKRLIDKGRAQILKCDLLRYCSDQITPENFAIISE